MSWAMSAGGCVGKATDSVMNIRMVPHNFMMGHLALNIAVLTQYVRQYDKTRSNAVI